MSDPIGPGNFKRKKRSADDSIFQIHRQQAHDELDDSRLNDDQLRDRNTAKVHAVRARQAANDTTKTHFMRGVGFREHSDSAQPALLRVLGRTIQQNDMRRLQSDLEEEVKQEKAKGTKK